MIDHDIFRHVDYEQQCVNFAYAVGSLAKAGRLALENDNGGISSEHKESAVATVFEVIEAMMAVVIDGAETFERELGKGVYAKKEASHEAA